MARSWNWRNPSFILVPACLLALAWLLQRHLGLNPAVFADEWYYSKMSRLAGLQDAIVPSYLYLWLFRSSKACGDGFLDCVRIGNALFFVGAAPFVYLTARAFTTAGLALLVAGLSLFAPINTYTGFFMPETMYYFGFCVLSWIALALTHGGRAWRALACGAVLGLMSLVKVHALFLLPPLCLFLLYEHWPGRATGPWLGRAALALAGTVAAAFATKFALGYLFAGPAGFTLFGELYGSSAVHSSHRPLLDLAAPALVNLRGHLMALAVLLALPLVMLGYGLASREARDASPRRTRLYLYTLLMLGAALGMTVLYTASISAPGNKEALRLHLRYYNFVFPLLSTSCAASIAAPPARGRPVLRGALALLLLALMALALARLPGYSLNMIDGPDIAAINLRAAPGLLVLGLDVLALFLWVRGHPGGARLFLFAITPLALLVAARAEHNVVRELAPSPAFYADEAGEVARRLIPQGELRQTTVAATGMAELYRVQFHLDAIQVNLLDLPPGAAVAATQVPADGKWLLAVGDHALPPGFAAVAAKEGFELARAIPRGQLVGSARLGGALPDGVVEAVQGLSIPEGWGRWSDSKHVVIRLSAPLPRHATVVLTAAAYGPNSWLPFTMRVGSGSAAFLVGSSMGQVALRFETDGNARELAIEVPQPVSPHALGKSADERALGIRLARIDVFTDQLSGLSSR